MNFISNINLELNHKTIVLVYMLYFGDTVALTPFLEVLRRAAPDSKIILVMDGNYLDAMEYNPCIDEIIPVKRKELGISGTIQLGRKLHSYHPDLLFVLHGTARTTLLGLNIRAKTWIGRPGTRLDGLLMDYPIHISDEKEQCAITYLNALKRIGVTDISCEGMKLYSCPAWDEGAKKFFESHGIQRGDKLAGYSVGSTRIEKDWPAERFGQVAEHFAKKGYRPVFFGIKREMELVERAVKGLKCDPIIAADQLSMGEFIAAASWCSIGFTNDSGPMYVFDARGIPTVAMFGPSNAKNHYPLGKRSTAISSWDMPVGQDHVNHTIRDGNYVPIDHIPVEEVIKAGEWALGMRETDEYDGHIKYVK